MSEDGEASSERMEINRDLVLVPSADGTATKTTNDPFQVDFSLDIDTGPAWTGM